MIQQLELEVIHEYGCWYVQCHRMRVQANSRQHAEELKYLLEKFYSLGKEAGKSEVQIQIKRAVGLS